MSQPVVALRAGLVCMLAALSGSAETPAPTDLDGPMPVAEFNVALPSDPAEAAVRAARNQRFSLNYFGPITEDFGEAVLSTHPRRRSEKDLVKEADAIVEATVLDASAHMAENRKILYSEFRVRIAGALKDRALSREQPALVPGHVIVTLRAGGAVRFPTGQVSKQIWAGQHLPTVGSTCILFLRREPAIEAFTIITGYEVKGSEVDSLDDVYYFPQRRGAPAELFRQEILALVEQSGD